MTANNINRVTVIVLDSVGCGDAPDAAAFGDLGANTLGHIAEAVAGLSLPHLGALGMGNLTHIEGTPPTSQAAGAFGRLTEASLGKDTTSGHWELAGLILHQPFPTYPEGFPREVLDPFEQQIGRKILGNYPASGTVIIEELGKHHLYSGCPIVYTSADSVFQIAAHEEIIPIEELYRMCQIARDILTGNHAVGRVIARPFIGQPGSFTRTERRKDFSLQPPGQTILDVAKDAGQAVMAVGKIEDIYAHRGITHSDHTGNNMAGVDAVLNFLATDHQGLIFANLVDFDALYGHRNNPQGYAQALREFDARLPELLAALKEDDVLMITADHGNDPTWPGTDHTRERVPLLITGQSIRKHVDLSTRDTFSDLAATIAELLRLPWSGDGQSFAAKIVRS